ncbi:hypothetical protein GT037_011048 [Alternaria burnsii]|uniref:Methyltransferase n=1 Tax=Alternaria burnsii TaxID=1187904 RepID=A0A8H7AUT3_9PLEO|nr:uncharacterized protein GT037_011048 [Alternaria burnsii]KAF7670920.1 hypothetical protein GT037_011048 [Alternaria burnsii]
MMVNANIEYLSRLDLYETEKPYMTAFEIPSDVGSMTNHEYSAHMVEVQDARDNKASFSLDVHGFKFCDWPTKYRSADFEDEDLIESKYYQEVLQQMTQGFPDAMEIHIVSHLRRKRNEVKATSEPGPGTSKHANTITYAHTDFSPDGAKIAVEHIVEKHAHLRGRRFEVINLWRVTKGPNRDWPLALCDYTSVDLEDVDLSDVIHKDRVGESTRLYFNSSHRWFYLDKQTTSEVALFRNVDSRGLQYPFAMHLSFANPNVHDREGCSDPPRESIETRFALFY